MTCTTSPHSNELVIFQGLNYWESLRRIQRHIYLGLYTGCIQNNFAVDQKVRRFSLTLEGEARLWYQSIHPLPTNWEDLQRQFRTQFSKNTRALLLHSSGTSCGRFSLSIAQTSVATQLCSQSTNQYYILGPMGYLPEG